MDTLENGQGSVVEICGEPGAGKTTPLPTLHDADGVLVLDDVHWCDLSDTDRTTHTQLRTRQIAERLFLSTASTAHARNLRTTFAAFDETGLTAQDTFLERLREASAGPT